MPHLADDKMELIAPINNNAKENNLDEGRRVPCTGDVVTEGLCFIIFFYETKMLVRGALCRPFA